MRFHVNVYSDCVVCISSVVMLNMMNDEIVVILTAFLTSAAESRVEML